MIICRIIFDPEMILPAPPKLRLSKLQMIILVAVDMVGLIRAV